jgi:hypothetical protein
MQDMQDEAPPHGDDTYNYPYPTEPKQVFSTASTSAPEVLQEEHIPLLHPASGTETQVQIQEGRSHEVETHCCGLLRRSPHLRGFLFNLVLWASCAFFVAMLIITQYSGLDLPSWVFTFSWAFLIAVASLYAIEAMVSATSRYLWNMSAVEDLIAHIERVKRAPPQIFISCTCYHDETRTRTVTRTDHNSDGSTSTSNETETYTVTVVTHQETDSFRFEEWDDTSGGVTNEVAKYNATRVDFVKEWVAGDAYTEQCHSHWEEAFHARNRDRDTHYSYVRTLQVPGFTSKMLTIVDLSRKSWAMSWWWYAVVSLVLLSSSVYRLWLDRSSVKAHFRYTKRVFIRQC